MEIYNEDQILENLRRCQYFDACSRNLCPLDLELQLRTGGMADQCRYMRNAKTSKIAGQEFVSGGAVMPDALLNFVPESSLKLLNIPSQERWKKLKSF